MAELEAARPGEGFAPGDPGPTGAALTAYFAGELRTFDEELDVSGSPAARAVWSAIAAIPYGHVRSYGQIAAAAGLGRTAARAAGAACGRNPVSIVVPCHRVVGADGRLVGYGGGLERKRWLLAHEAAVSSRAG